MASRDVTLVLGSGSGDNQSRRREGRWKAWSSEMAAEVSEWKEPRGRAGGPGKTPERGREETQRSGTSEASKNTTLV